MHLKKLSLHGYKSFANKTDMLFDTGITAIVGPNGSGKSNIADAIRWVLGEQSYKALRGKSTGDMIFAGSPKRPQMGMAHVSITLDNSNGRIPLDFTEITITRRAYRSGENEYRINGKRVRLRDLQELLSRAGLGHLTYAFIGQGMVDAALSLRPQERRTLLEEAAGIAPYREKRNKALQEMEETRLNLIRLYDILAEITPNLERLREQSYKAEEYNRLLEDLRELMRTWYGYQWHLHTEALKIASREERKIQSLLQEARIALEELERRLKDVRSRKQKVQEQLQALREKISAGEKALSEFDREAAVLEERIVNLRRREEELKGELESRKARREELARRLRDVQEQLRELESQARARQKVWAALERPDIQAYEQEVRRLRSQVVEVQSRLKALRHRMHSLENEGKEMESHRLALQQELERLREEEERLVSQQAEVEKLQGEEDKLKGHLNRLEAEMAQLKTEIESRRGRQEALKARLHTLEGFIKPSEPFSGDGLLGPLVQLIEVPNGVEKAIEAALSSFLEAWVVRTSYQALEILCNSKGDGQHLLLPLDSVRDVPALSPPQVDGVLGRASDMVKCKSDINPVIRLLLSRTLIVRDMETARKVLEIVRGEELPAQIVTLKGEILHSYGPMGRGHSGRVLIEKERKQYEAELHRVVAEEANLSRRLEGLRDQKARLTGQLQELTRKLEVRKAALESRKSELKARIQELESRIRWQKERREELQRDRASLARREEKLLSRLDAIRSRLRELETTLRSLGTEEELAAIRTEMALWKERKKDLLQRRNLLESDMRRVDEECRELQEKVKSARQEIQQAEQHLARLRKLNKERMDSHEELLRNLQELERTLARLDEEEQAVRGERDERQTCVNRYELLLNQARIQREKARDELVALRKRIREELGLIEMHPGESPGQRPLPLEQPGGVLPVVKTLPPNLEGEIKRIKGMLKRLGPVNPEAPREYRALKGRYDFLKSQTEDLEEALKRLKDMIADLDREMEKRFMETFQAVDKAFRFYFRELFQGGKARLVLTDADNWEEAGVEIEVSPPGKRHRGLAMLSGGEKALTAVALLFAILKVRPVPFCVLDEVDAMLDEANVGRFCAVLKELAQSIQFIVITHNRGTVEASDTIYGVSMGEDGASQVISLRLDEIVRG